ncbi:hypothetical protein KSP39_PZI021936 [Platanthera zijinensis]|uniref:Uncharacterized protein n=1 Tax=Platanthera zijinensis TaxID=2320716 RepID=A0AAP0AY19_9ASPA
MNNIDLVLQDIAKTQRSVDALVRPCPEILPESILTQTPPFYSSAFDRPTSEPCVCGQQSSTLNMIQKDWFRDDSTGFAKLEATITLFTSLPEDLKVKWITTRYKNHSE